MVGFPKFHHLAIDDFNAVPPSSGDDLLTSYHTGAHRCSTADGIFAVVGNIEIQKTVLIHIRHRKTGRSGSRSKVFWGHFAELTTAIVFPPTQPRTIESNDQIQVSISIQILKQHPRCKLIFNHQTALNRLILKSPPSPVEEKTACAVKRGKE